MKQSYEEKKISRVEVIGKDGREYVRYLKDEELSYQIQDDGRTLKIFLNEGHAEIKGDNPCKADWADGVDNSPYDLFAKELKGLINTHCLENLTDTPDYILAAYVVEALKALENLHHAKRIWKK